MHKWYLVINSLFFFGCNSEKIVYNISDKYTGPCVVFLDIQNKIQDEGNRITVRNGLGAMNNNKMKKKFTFRSIETQSQFEIVELGKESSVGDSARYIFRLTQGNTTSKCVTGELYLVSFFVGKKSEYLNWSNNFYSELLYFESIGVDWCAYYKSRLEIK